MEKFEYKVKDDQGETRKGVVEAVNSKQAARILREKSFLVISLRPRGRPIVSEIRGSIFNRVSSSDKVNFTRQLSTMIAAGLPVTDALGILEGQSSPAMGKIVGEILREIEGGGSLGSALEKHPEVFDKVFISLVKAGETAGLLDKILNRLADNLEKDKEFSGKIKAAMIYPAIVVVAMLVVATIMILFVIPKMTAIYEEFQAQLPAPTKILLAVSKFATSYFWLFPVIIIGAIFGVRSAMLNPQFRKTYEGFMFKIPIIGKIQKQVMLTEFTRTLSLLLGSGILVVDAIGVLRDSLKSAVYREAIDRAGKDVERGLPLAAALAKTDVFPQILPEMLAVGEETGKIDEVLMKVSSYFEQEAEVAIRGLTAAIEPLIMIVLGVGVGFLVIAVIMPIYNLTSQF